MVMEALLSGQPFGEVSVKKINAEAQKWAE